MLGTIWSTCWARGNIALKDYQFLNASKGLSIKTSTEQISLLLGYKALTNL
jgi:hypothetical protein